MSKIEEFFEPDATKPTEKEADALRVILGSDWLFHEFEQANYHSAWTFLEELERGIVQP